MYHIADEILCLLLLADNNRIDM